MPVQINELVIRAEIVNEQKSVQNNTPAKSKVKIQKMVDELVKINKNKNER
ncbi:MAG TPA: DUF5908 family protein [Bacteroidales bacterium]|jgi:hypothetical protein|nr:hypothetical protein [Bacteroidales bacterium]HNZ43950.1 DUF5908 family protein [Bacteroidales bacterium]HOH84148.1 DUF5908 family protein [Bacteroidales bacterium]HPB24309.1 DUF5908 family protein [Bacteroidales bacterium]HPI28974.1 DUF5908 family protein [Bacteroidales bacterium]